MYHKISAPVSCQIELTNSCNHSCIHCYNYWRQDKEVKALHMSREVLIKTLTDIVSANVFHVTFTGGEPFLRKELLFEGVEFLMKNGVVCDINSNLTCITASDAKRLKGFGVGGILTSVAASSADLHDHIVQKSGALSTTLKGVKTAQDAGLSIAASMVVTKMNVHDVYRTGVFLHNLGVRQFYATKASPPIISRNFSQYMLSRKQLISLLKQLRSLRDEVGLTVGALECYPLCSYTNQDAYAFMTDRRCSAGITTCSIGANGDVRACSHDDAVYGNITSDGLITSWGAMTEWRDGSIVPNECKACKAFPACSGGCRVDAAYIHGAKNMGDPYMKIEEVANIVWKGQQESIDFSKTEHPLRVTKWLKFRDEGFCVLCAGIRNIASPVTLSISSYALVKHLAKKSSFGLSEIVCYTKLTLHDANTLCNIFVRDGVFESIKS